MTAKFKALNIALLTVSDSRSDADDKSGDLLSERVIAAGHNRQQKCIVRDDRYEIRAMTSQWIADPAVDVIICTGGTGLTGRDITVEAMEVLFDKTIPGFGEIFRQLSFQKIATSTIQSRTIAGLANGTVIFCLPGSPGACKDAWDQIIVYQLDITTRPCNLAEIMPRFLER